MARPCRRIQKSIHVSTITASTAASPSMLSWTTNGSWPTVRLTTAPTAMDRPTAAPTPNQMRGRAS